MQRLKDLWNRSDPFFLPGYQDLAKRNEILEKALMSREKSTPPPDVSVLSQYQLSMIQLPRIPINIWQLYDIRHRSVVLRTVCFKLKQEIFRETLKEGWEFTPAFKYKCITCRITFDDDELDQCPYCKAALLEPDPFQKEIWKNFNKKCNSANQSLLTVFQELEDDLNTVDDCFLVVIKDYIVSRKGIEGEKVKEVMRGSPQIFRKITNEQGVPGGEWWVCPEHREIVKENAGESCPECNQPLQEVWFIETEGDSNKPKKYYLAGEVIHSSKYEPSRTYGVSPIWTLWVLTKTVLNMDVYVDNIYEKGRIRGVLGVPTDNTKYVKKWMDEQQKRVQQDPGYTPVIAIEGGDKGKGKLEFVKFIDSLADMQYTEAKRDMRLQISAMFGISPIFQADVSTSGGLNNEGLQITVTNRAVEFGQAIHHNNLIPRLQEMLNITDWIITLQPTREEDKMAELQRQNQKIQNARGMLEMGYEVIYKEGEFEYEGEASLEALHPQAGMQSGFSPFDNTPGPTGQPEPANTQGGKQCPPGMVATPQNPRCHPIEWEFNKDVQPVEQDLSEHYLWVKCKESTFQKELLEAQQPGYKLFWTLNKVGLVGDWRQANRIFFITEKGVRGFFETKEYGIEKYKGNITPVVYFHPEFNPVDIDKSGDMMAHYSCIASKFKKKGYPLWPKNTKTTEDFRAWLSKTSPEQQAYYKKINQICLSAGSTQGKHYGDPDYPYPEPIKQRDSHKSNFNYGLVNDSFDKEGLDWPFAEEVISKGNPMESGSKLQSKTDKIEASFTKRLTTAYNKALQKLSQIDDKSPASIERELDKIISSLIPDIEKLAFQEVTRAYLAGKKQISELDLAKMAPPFTTSGGKAKQARRLVSLTPKHDVCTESACGAASFFLKKEPSQKEILNDIDPDVVLIWKYIQAGGPEKFQQLAKKQWLPNEAHFNQLRDAQLKEGDILGRVYRKIYLRRYSNFANEKKFAQKDYRDMQTPMWLRKYESFEKYTNRLKGVEIHNLDWRECIKQYDSPTAFHFIDLPYEDEFAKQLVEFLPTIKGKYLVTFSDNPMLREKFKEQVHEIKIQAQQNWHHLAGRFGKGFRKELLIANYPIEVPPGTVFKEQVDLFKEETAPSGFIDWSKIKFSKPDIQVLRAIYSKNPFWQAFAGISQALSNQFKEIIRKSYLAPTEAEFKRELKRVKEKYPAYDLQRQMEITYMRVGKFSLAQTIDAMEKISFDNIYRLERIARSETTAITAKGREIASQEAEKRTGKTFLYDWFGPVDHRTSDQCKEIQRRVQKAGKGNGVPLDKLKEIMEGVVEDFNKINNADWQYRDWLPHANCRRVLRVVGMQ